MTRSVAWVLAAVLSAGAAGVASGFALCGRGGHEEFDLQAADRQVVERFTANFDLTDEQVTLLRAILSTLHQDETAIYRRNFRNLPDAVQEELSTARRAADTRIMFMLDAGQRARYEQERAIQQPRR
jgi:hypothetical protein